jgi:hypothetical protein
MLVTRVSHVHVNPDNVKHGRRIQSSNEAVFLEAMGGVKVAIPNDFIAAVMAVVEPATTFPPHFTHESKPGSVKVVSEIPHNLQWQVSDHQFHIPNNVTEGWKPPEPAVWDDIAGETSEVLDESKVTPGKFIRCVATNAAGKSITPPVKKA